MGRTNPLRILKRAKFEAKYQVLKNVFNELQTDTIEFIVYDHYGRPQFENYENVILYNTEGGNFYHQKYQFDPVKKPKNGIWKGLNGESIEKLFNEKKDRILAAHGLFDE